MADWGEQHWAEAHAEGYDKSVFSITPDQGVRDRTIHEIRHTLSAIPSSLPRILLPGCGTETILENDIAKLIQPNPFVLCTDFQAVADIARKRNLESNVAYEGRDSRALDFHNQFDAVVVMNSVVAPSDAENRQMLKSFHDALVPGGALIGLFPTIFCALDVALTITKPEMTKAIIKSVKLKKSMVVDGAHDAHQVFYSPLGLRSALLDAGFSAPNMKIDLHFMDSPYFKDQSRRLYGLEAEDPPIYELFVVVRKNSGPAPAP